MLVAATSFAEGRDVTAKYLRNADMEQGVKYWAIEGEQPLGKNTKKVEMVVGFHGMYQGVTEAWKSYRRYLDEVTYEYEPLGNSVMLQRIPNLPNGTYVFGAYVGASHQNARNWQENVLWSNRETIYGVSLYANENEVPVATDNPDWGGIVKWAHTSKFNVATKVTNGRLEVGLRVDSTNANYVVWDNATLYYFGNMSEAEALDAMAQIDMERAAAVAQELTTAKMNVDTLLYLNNAMEHAMEGNTTAATLWDDNEEIYYSIGLARKSISSYERFAEEIKAAKVVAAGEWSENAQWYVNRLNEVIAEAEEQYAVAQMNDDELAFMRKALSWSAGDVKYDSLYIALEVLEAFIDEARDVEGVPGGYTSAQIQNLMGLNSEVIDTMCIYESDAEQEMAERIVNPNDLMSYIESIYAAIENVKNNAISTEYTQMPIEFKRSATPIEGYCYIEGAELNAEGLIAFASPLYRFENTIETFRITVNSAANNQSYFCLSELAVYDGSGNRIWLTEDDVTSNADHNALNPNRQDGGGIPALFDEDTNTYFHSTWLAGSSDGGAHYLEITLPDGGYDAFSFQMIARAPQSVGVYNQNYTFPGEMVISTPAPEREALEVWIGAAKNLNPYSFPEVGFYEYDHSYLTDAIAKAEALIANYPSEEECRAMNIELREAVLAFEANENKAIRLPEAGKAYRIVSAFPGFFEKQGVEKTVTINEELQTLWWEDVQIDKSLQEFVFEPVLDENGEHYIEIESGENWDGTIYEEVYYCYYVKNVATGLYMGDVVDYSFGLSEEATDTVRLKWLGRGQWNINFAGRIMHAGDHNGGNPSTNSGNYGGTSGISSGLVPYSGSIDSQSAWFIREYQSLPYDLMAVAGEYKSELIRFESGDFFTLTADKPCAFANLKLYDMYGSEIAIDNLAISGNTATIRQENRLAAFSFAFTNNEGVSSVVVDMNKASEALEVLRVVYEAGLSLNPQEGTGVMQYADISAYTAAMAKAEAMLASGAASEEEVRAMTAELDDAIVSLVPNMPVPGRMYYIVSAMDAFADNHGVSMMIYDDAEYGLRWTYENLYDLNRCWEFVPAEGEEGYYLKNAGTGMYMGYDTYSTAFEVYMVGSKEETIPYTISSLGGDVVAIAASINEFSKLHARGHNSGLGKSGNICYWNAGAGTASAWRICDAEAYGLQVFSGYAMSAQNVETRAMSVVNLPIEMVNAAEVTAFQFDLYLPAGVSVASFVEDGEAIYDITLNGDRAKSSHIVAAEPQADGALRIVAYSTKNAVFAGNDGVLANVALMVDSLADGDYEIEMRNIRMVTPDEKEMKAADYSSLLTVKSILMGDVNNDGEFSMLDVVMMVNAVLEIEQTNFNFAAADLNGDGMISMVDVVGVLRLVLTGGEAMAPARAARGAEVMPELSAGEFAIVGNGRVVLPVALNNREAYSAFQLDVVLPAGVELAEATLTGRAKASHTIAWNTLADGSVRVVAYAMNNAAFRDNEGSLLNLVLDIEDATDSDAVLTLADGLFATAGGAEHRAADLDVMMRSDATGVDEAYAAAFAAYGVKGAVEVTCGAETVVDIYAVSGQLVCQKAVKAGKTVIALPAGVYMVNGNKVIVK